MFHSIRFSISALLCMSFLLVTPISAQSFRKDRDGSLCYLTRSGALYSKNGTQCRTNELNLNQDKLERLITRVENRNVSSDIWNIPAGSSTQLYCTCPYGQEVISGRCITDLQHKNIVIEASHDGDVFEQGSPVRSEHGNWYCSFRNRGATSSAFNVSCQAACIAGNAQSVVTVTPKSSADAVVQRSAIDGRYDIAVQSLAWSGFVLLEVSASTADTPIVPDLATPSWIKFHVGSNSNETVITIPVTNSTTLGSIINQLNSVNPSLIAAGIEGADYPDKQVLYVSAVQSGVQLGTINVEVDQTLSARNEFELSFTWQASDAKFSIAGLGSFTRPSNTITDLIDGVALRLFSTGNITLSIDSR